MRKAMIVGMMALAGFGAREGQGAGKTTYQVIVYMQGERIANRDVVFQAKVMAARPFAEIGVRLRWNTGEPPSARDGSKSAGLSPARTEIVVRMASGTPTDFQRGALGDALPYAESGVQVTVFYDRVMASAGGATTQTAFLLAHVLAHEIGHVLQGVTRHSETGLMKAQLTREDWAQAQRWPLPFTAYDVELIQLAMASRQGTVQIAAR